MPPLAVIEPVNKNPISIIEKNPTICQVMALVRSLTLLSIEFISAQGGKVAINLSRKGVRRHYANLLR